MWFKILQFSVSHATGVGNCLHTLKPQVAHMQDGSQQLGDLTVLRLCEHEDLHGRQDAGIIAEVITAVTFCALSLKSARNSKLKV